MRRPLLLLILALAACTPPPRVAFPAGDVPPSPGLLPTDSLRAPAASTDPGPALNARAAALRASQGL